HLSPVDGVVSTFDADLVLAMNGQAEGGETSRLPRITGDVLVTQFEYTRPIGLTTDLSAFGVRAKRTNVDSYDPTLATVTFDVRALPESRPHTDAGAVGASAGGGGTVSVGVRGGVWRITMHAYGVANNLRLDMTSDPPLSQEDIVLLLTIGMTRAEVDQLQA